MTTVNGVSALNGLNASSSASNTQSTEMEQTFNYEVAEAGRGTSISGKKARTQQLLQRYGINQENAEWVGIDFAEVVKDKKTGEDILVLRNSGEWQLELPINDKFKPEKLEMWLAEDECNAHFKGVNGKLRILGEHTKGYPESQGFAFHNSNIEVFCKDGIADNIATYKGTKMVVHTNEYSDVVYDRSKKPHVTNADPINLRPDKNGQGTQINR